MISIRMLMTHVIADLSKTVAATIVVLNRKKTNEIVLYDRKRQRCRLQPPEIPEIAQVSVLKVLGVVITNSL